MNRKLIPLSLAILIAGLSVAKWHGTTPPRSAEVLTWNLQWFPGNKQGEDTEAEARHKETVSNKVPEKLNEML